MALNGAPAPDGTTVTALIEGTEVAAATVTDGAYAFAIPQPPGESFGGKTVTFLIGDATANETGGWQTDGGGELDLTATGTPAPQLTANAAVPPSEPSSYPESGRVTSAG